MVGRRHALRVLDYLLGLQERVCTALEEADGTARFSRQELAGERGGRARPRLLSDGAVIEKAAVQLSHTAGAALPAAATAARPHLAGSSYEAASVSLIVHPRNPHAPTSHANVRFFCATKPGVEPVWWFGGGFDLTPFYGYEEDVRHWHETARAACAPFGPKLYRRLARACDEYFHLPHRGEPRGVGGLFFDDWSEGGFERSFELARSVGDHWLPAYLPILARRKDTPYDQRQRDWQLERRGRYVEFNLLYDRGTRFGLQAGGRVESILASLPPLAAWPDAQRPVPGSPEQRLLSEFLVPRDWLAPGNL